MSTTVTIPIKRGDKYPLSSLFPVVGIVDYSVSIYLLWSQHASRIW